MVKKSAKKAARKPAVKKAVKPVARKAAKPAKKRAAKKAAPKKHVLKAAEMSRLQRVLRDGPNAEQTVVALGAALGLANGVHFVRVPGGKQSLPPKLGTPNEEWLYVLYGQGVCRVAGRDVPVGAGDFLAFPAPQADHRVRNDGFDDLVFLTGAPAIPLKRK